MKKWLYILLILFVYSCSNTPNEPAFLYKKFMNQKPGADITELKGEGKLVIPNFMSWGLFNYNYNKGYIDTILRFNNFFENSEFNKKFERDNVKNFPVDLSFWTERLKENLYIDLPKQNCIYLNGTNFPYIHDILIDTVNYRVLHLVSAMRN